MKRNLESIYLPDYLVIVKYRAIKSDMFLSNALWMSWNFYKLAIKEMLGSNIENYIHYSHLGSFIQLHDDNLKVSH